MKKKKRREEKRREKKRREEKRKESGNTQIKSSWYKFCKAKWYEF